MDELVEVFRFVHRTSLRNWEAGCLEKRESLPGPRSILVHAPISFGRFPDGVALAPLGMHWLAHERRGARDSSLQGQVPVRVRRLVVEDPGAQEPPVGRRLPADRVEEGTEHEVQPPQVVEGDGGEVVVFEVIGRVEDTRSPTTATASERCPTWPDPPGRSHSAARGG